MQSDAQKIRRTVQPVNAGTLVKMTGDGPIFPADSLISFAFMLLTPPPRSASREQTTRNAFRARSVTIALDPHLTPQPKESSQ
jgi:hypothetical protein